jgi:hypothetical protein
MAEPTANLMREVLEIKEMVRSLTRRFEEEVANMEQPEEEQNPENRQEEEEDDEPLIVNPRHPDAAWWKLWVEKFSAVKGVKGKDGEGKDGKGKDGKGKDGKDGKGKDDKGKDGKSKHDMILEAFGKGAKAGKRVLSGPMPPSPKRHGAASSASCPRTE